MNDKPALEERLSYPLHTNHELELMLNGVKPLAVFSYCNLEEFHSGFLADQNFDHHVKSGAFKKIERSVVCTSKNPLTFNYIMYTLPGEEWRAEAYTLLMEQLHNYGWSTHLERLQGTLLGYTQEQNDEHIAKLKAARKKT